MAIPGKSAIYMQIHRHICTSKILDFEDTDMCRGTIALVDLAEKY
jgi:hypothetical protein